ncbi:multifunctional CCA addition/repair protein [Candidatus Schneideria nysicola]|uniref:multifunctional CCA addition/repair protein n=1 Tax=Candidatus Schneideria nysicola TaxID=1081631 RepID=UPI001CAA6C93|nr:multifunctional CCA addition/repair protein [Candidatus Schneideria nysicola]UAJ65152.1 multifunctional CCA addition/repair protein [Candidatus Schneideria nysicola]
MERYLVGGAVRDTLLNLPVKEKDWVVIGKTPEEMLKAGYQQVGKDFPVFLDPNTSEEHALARVELKSGKGYHGFVCHTSPNVTLEEDLGRRDLTINAIAIDKNGKLIDPYHGQEDINDRLLRHVSDAFIEDPLRLLRVARFAARFAYLNFKIASETMLIMQNMTNEIKFLSPERIWKETERALKTFNPEIYFQVLRQCGALKILFKEIDILFNIPYFINGDTKINMGIHALMTLSEISKFTDNIGLRFAALCHDLDKGINYCDNNNVCLRKNHSKKLGVKLVETMCKRLRIPNLVSQLTQIAVKYHEVLHNILILSSYSIITLFDKIDVWRRPERLEQLILIAESDFRVRDNSSKKISYPQADFIRKAYRLVKNIHVRKVIEDGFIGSAINREIHKRREQVLSIWRNQ